MADTRRWTRWLAGPVMLLSMVTTMATAQSITTPAPAHRPRPTTASIAFLDGLWIGPAWVLDHSGQRLTMTQMERIGPMIDGEIRLMEGKARDANGKAVFNAVTVFSQNADGSIEMRSHSPGHVGSRKLEILGGKGFAWEMAAGPNRIRYTANVTDGMWNEVGMLLKPDGSQTQIFQMNLKRVGATDWPAANAAFPTN